MSRPRKPLELELSTGCADRAVLGGLEAFLRGWAERVRAELGGPRAELAAGLAASLAGYAALAPDARRPLVQAALDGLQRTAWSPVAWEAPLTALSGVGPQRAEALLALGLASVGDLLLYYPVGYEDRSAVQTLAEAVHREPLTARLTVAAPGRAEYRMKPQRAVLPARDATGTCSLVWLHQPYVAGHYAPGDILLVHAQARRYPSGLSLFVQRVERLDPGVPVEGLVPRYAPGEGVSEEWLRRLIRQALSCCASRGPGPLPEDLARARDLMPLGEALAAAHDPPDLATASRARDRLVYESLFALQADLGQRRARYRHAEAGGSLPVEGVAAEWQRVLPFTLTAAQQRVVSEILADLAGPVPAHRLLHGEVGSGKTAVAGAALYAAVRAGRQAALMAPTEILAEQHARVLAGWFDQWGIPVALLTASVPAARAAALRRALASGEAPLVVGTHALVQSAVSFANLALAVVDEQHRFGVRHRAELGAKGEGVNLLVMSATPIPRTLALTAYGDFDISVLDELPPGRSTVHTEVLTTRGRRRAYETLTRRAVAGQRAFVICPVIEEPRADWLVSAEEWYAALCREVPSLRWGLVHGRLPAPEREAVMDAFRRGELDVLVATTVVEVGVDIPEAAMIIVENAERFGLAQLHQLRGRVARSPHSPLCLLISASRNPEVLDRLQVLARSSDGFVIAQEDLLRRGPGELLGSRQSGHVDLRLVEAAADTRRLLAAREDATALLAADPDLARPEHQPLRAYLERLGAGPGGWTL